MTLKKIKGDETKYQSNNLLVVYNSKLEDYVIVMKAYIFHYDFECLLDIYYNSDRNISEIFSCDISDRIYKSISSEFFDLKKHLIDIDEVFLLNKLNKIIDLLVFI